jgi:hypothetical protein
MSLARFVALCTGVGVLIALWQTHPLVLAPTSTVIDDGTLDAFQFTWNLWWVREALVELHTNPFHTRYLFYPEGIGLLFHTFSSTFGLLSIPLQSILPGGALTANNVLVMASPVMTVLAVGLLARDVTGDAWAALAGGLVAAMSPVAAWFLPVIYLHCGYLIALCLWAWGRLQRRAHAGWAILTGALVVALVFASAEYAMMALALLALDTVARTVLSRPLGLTRPWWPGTIGFWAVTGAGVLSLALFAGTDPAAPPPMRQLLWASCYVLAFVVPPWLVPPGKTFWSIVYLGTAPLLLLVPAGLLAPRRAAYWLLALAACLLMALGPYLHFTHPMGADMDAPPAVLDDGGLLGPYALAYELVPLLRYFRAPYRWLVPAQIVLGVLAAVGVAGLRRRLTLRRRGLITAVLLLAVPAWSAFDARGLRAPLREASIPLVYETLRHDPEPSAILELPSGIGPAFSLRSSLYMYYQTRHRKYLLEGTVSRLPPTHHPLVERRIDDFAALPYVKYVVIHRDLLRHSLPDSRAQVEAVERLLRRDGERLLTGNQIEVYRLRTFRPETVRPAGQP